MTGTGMTSPPVRSAASIAALTLSILASLFALIGGVALPIGLGAVAVGLATWGLILANRHGRGGRGLATWGLILGLLSVVYELLRLFGH